MGAVNNVKGQKEVRWGGHDRQARVRNPMDVYAEPRVQVSGTRGDGSGFNSECQHEGSTYLE